MSQTSTKKTADKKQKSLTIIGIIFCLILLPILIVNITLIAKSYIHADEVPSVGGKFPMIVLTDSMYPEIESGDLIICNTAEAEEIAEGDVISFYDPMGNGTGGSGTNIKGEFAVNGINNKISHKRGVISMARAYDPNSASSQFFIMHKDQTALDGYFAAFPGVIDYIERQKQLAREQGYAITLFGRKRYLPDILSHNATVRSFAERNAVNSPIQGTAADIIKMAMVTISRRLKDEGLKAKMIMQVHDELNFNVPHNEVDKVREIVVSEMQNVVHLSVALIADCGVGKNWLEAH